MKMFYRNALINAGFDEESEMYKEVNKLFDRDAKKYAYERGLRHKLGITFNRMSTFVGEESESFDCFPSDEDVEEKILHQMEIERLKECLGRLNKEDRDLLYRVYGSDYGEISKIASDMGIPYNDLYYRIRKLLKRLRRMMGERE